jgi:hypothetical protein
MHLSQNQRKFWFLTLPTISKQVLVVLVQFLCQAVSQKPLHTTVSSTMLSEGSKHLGQLGCNILLMFDFTEKKATGFFSRDTERHPMLIIYIDGCL